MGCWRPPQAQEQFQGVCSLRCLRYIFGVHNLLQKERCSSKAYLRSIRITSCSLHCPGRHFTAGPPWTFGFLLWQNFSERFNRRSTCTHMVPDTPTVARVGVSVTHCLKYDRQGFPFFF